MILAVRIALRKLQSNEGDDRPDDGGIKQLRNICELHRITRRNIFLGLVWTKFDELLHNC